MFRDKGWLAARWARVISARPPSASCRTVVKIPRKESVQAHVYRPMYEPMSPSKASRQPAYPADPQTPSAPTGDLSHKRPPRCVPRLSSRFVVSYARDDIFLSAMPKANASAKAHKSHLCGKFLLPILLRKNLPLASRATDHIRSRSMAIGASVHRNQRGLPCLTGIRGHPLPIRRERKPKRKSGRRRS